ncbi:MAG: outer membrane beta-barrel protein [Pseudomonadota bacterium]
MLYKTFFALMAATLLVVGKSALAVEGGFYLGGSLGGAASKLTVSNPDQADFKFDETDFAWKVFGGYHFLQFFAVEATYRDFGSPSTTTGSAKIDQTATDVSGLVGLPLGPLFLFGKLGVVFWDADYVVDGNKSSDSGPDFSAGLGASLDITRIRLRGEVEYFDIGDHTLMYTVGAAWLF